MSDIEERLRGERDRSIQTASRLALDVAERDSLIMEYKAEIERLTATNAGLVREAQKAWHKVERLKAALRPLLKHYLNCYDGNEDQLAKDARAALERE